MTLLRAFFALLLGVEYLAALLRGETNRFGAPVGASTSNKKARLRPAEYLAPVGRGSTGRTFFLLDLGVWGVDKSARRVGGGGI